MGQKILAMFPGQGSQYAGMAKKILKDQEGSLAYLAELGAAANVPLREICEEADAAFLSKTAVTQPAVYGMSMAIWRILLRSVSGFTPDYFAGHSLGEYSALAASRRIRDLDGARLVRRRGELMQEAVPMGVGAMAAVLGDISGDELSSLCEASSTSECFVEVANFNSPSQHVVSGHAEAVERLVSALERPLKAITLPVSAPFHCSLMTPAAISLRESIETLPFATSGEGLIIPNVTAREVKDYDKSLLVDQVTGSVLWTATLRRAYELGCRVFVEVGPGKVLSGLATKTLPKDVEVIPTDDLESALTRLSGLRNL